MNCLELEIKQQKCKKKKVCCTNWAVFIWQKEIRNSGKAATQMKWPLSSHTAVSVNPPPAVCAAAPKPQEWLNRCFRLQNAPQHPAACPVDHIRFILNTYTGPGGLVCWGAPAASIWFLYIVEKKDFLLHWDVVHWHLHINFSTNSEALLTKNTMVC